MQVMCPIPKHLENNMLLEMVDNHDSRRKGTIVCDCGGKQFEVLYYGELHAKFLSSTKVLHPFVDEIDQSRSIAVTLKCKDCGKTIPLFDNHIHGYDAYKFQKKQISPNQFNEYQCNKCKSKTFHVDVEFGHIEEDELDVLKPVQEEIPPFDWIKVALTCQKCKRVVHDFIDYETM